MRLDGLITCSIYLDLSNKYTLNLYSLLFQMKMLKDLPKPNLRNWLSYKPQKIQKQLKQKEKNDGKKEES